MGEPTDSVGVSARAPSREEQHALDRAAFINGDEATEDAPKPAKKPAPKVKDEDGDEPDSAETDEDADDAEETASQDDADEDDDEDDADSDDSDDDDEGDDDPELAKRLAQVRKTEQRLRAQLAEQRAELQREIDSWKPRIAKVQEFEQLSKRAKYEPAAVLRALGLSEEDMEDAARDIYANSTKGSADPKNKEAVARSRRERELADKLSAMEKKLAERDEAEKKAQVEREAEQQVQSYLRGIAKKVDAEKFPLAAAQKTKNAARFEEKIALVAHQLAQKTGEWPSAPKVLARYERMRREELEELGVDPTAIAVKSKTNPKAADKTNGKKSAPSKNGAALPDRPSRAQLLAELEAGDFD